MAEYMPTDVEVRHQFIKGEPGYGVVPLTLHDADYHVVGEEFDRWLADHDREVRENALREFLTFRFLPVVVREYIEAYLEGGVPDDVRPGGAQ